LQRLWKKYNPYQATEIRVLGDHASSVSLAALEPLVTKGHKPLRRCPSLGDRALSLHNQDMGPLFNRTAPISEPLQPHNPLNLPFRNALLRRSRVGRPLSSLEIAFLNIHPKVQAQDLNGFRRIPRTHGPVGGSYRLGPHSKLRKVPTLHHRLRRQGLKGHNNNKAIRVPISNLGRLNSLQPPLGRCRVVPQQGKQDFHKGNSQQVRPHRPGSRILNHISITLLVHTRESILAQEYPSPRTRILSMCRQAHKVLKQDHLPLGLILSRTTQNLKQLKEAHRHLVRCLFDPAHLHRVA
jgi:hypothetical protein